MDYTTNRILKVFGKRNEGPAAIDGVKAVLVFMRPLTPVCSGSGQLRLTALSWGVGEMGQDWTSSKLLTGFLRPEWGVGGGSSFYRKPHSPTTTRFCFVSCGYWYYWVSFSDTGSSATQTEGHNRSTWLILRPPSLEFSDCPPHLVCEVLRLEPRVACMLGF